MADRRFVVSCLHCKRVVMVVTKVGGEELEQLRTHLRAYHLDKIAGPSPGVEATLRHFHVAPTDSNDKPPPGA